MADLDDAARQALQDVLALKEEVASATGDLDDLRLLLAELMEAFAREEGRTADELDRHAQAADLRQKEVESDQEETDSDFDTLTQDIDEATDDLAGLFQRADEELEGLDEWCDHAADGLEQDLESLEAALSALEDAAAAAVVSNQQVADMLVGQSDALTVQEMVRLEREAIERAREAEDTLRDTLAPQAEEAMRGLARRMEASGQEIEDAAATASAFFAREVEADARVWQDAHMSLLADLESRAADIEQVVEGLVAEALEHMASLDGARDALAEGRDALRDRLANAHDTVVGLLERLRPLGFVQS
jgi:hypothetical protein